MSVDVYQGDKEGLDRSHRYLRPVSVTTISGEPDGIHWSVYEWLPKFEAWATGLALCGASADQGALPAGTVVTCEGCEAYRPKYERYLAPGYDPADDDPDVLRRRAESAERQVAQAQALVAKWRRVAVEREGAVVLVGVAADVLYATLNGLNDLLSEVSE